MTTYTDTIGTGGSFATLTLWHSTSASVPVSGDVMDVEFLSGTHDIGGTYNSFTATDLTINLKAHTSALHDGEWDGPVQINWSTRPEWYFDDQTINLNLNDLVIKMTSNNFFLWEHIGTSGSSAGYDSNLTFNRCLISNWSQDYAFISVSYVSLFDGPAASPTAYGTFKWEMNNCVVEQQNAARNLLFNSDTGVTNPYYAQKRYFNGCTFKNVSFGDRSTDNGPLDVQVSGCMNDSGTTRLVPIITASPYTATVTDYITGETTSNAQFGLWATGTNTNVSTAASFNYDGTVTAGEVCFVGPSGPEGNYRLIADLDNLPVEYMDLSSFSEQEDIAGRRRPGLTNPGPYQMYDDSVISATIGSGVDGVSANYATLAILKSTIADDILNGQTLEAVLQNQSHHFNIQTFGSNALKEVDQNWIVRNEDTQDGLWDNGARFTSDYNHNIFNAILRHAFSLELRDIVINNTTTNSQIKFGQAVSGSIHDTELFINRCLVNTHADFHYAYPTLVSVRDGEYNTHTLKIFDSVITGPLSGNTRFLDSYYFSQGGGNDFAALGNHNVHIKGSTIFNRLIGRGNFTSPTSNNTVKVEGTLFGLFVPNSTTLFYRNNLIDSLTINDTLISNSSSREAGLTGSINNVEFDTDFYFDNQSRNDAVTFIGSALDPDGPLDFRLVADLDNLAVKYMTSGELSYKDITGYKRPGGTDQRDAGAFQSISDKDTVYKIGTSSVDFPAEYATLSLWTGSYYNNANVLNGETHTLQFKSGETHSPAAIINFNGINGNVSANVNQSFIYSGQTPHNGDWDEGASFGINGLTNGATVRCGKNSFNFTVKDLSLVVSGNAQNRRLLYIQPTHNSNYTIPGYLAPEHTYTFENFMARMDDGLSSIPWQLMMDQNYERITDEDLNVIERGSSKSIHKNCLYVGAASSNGVAQRGSLCVYAHQYGTAASAFFQTEGCTFINSWFSNSRHEIIYDLLKVDHAGLLYYASESHLNQFGRQLSLHSPGGFGTAQSPDQTTKAANSSKFVDCIFNNGAGDSIASLSYQDRYSTWVIQPLASEYNDSTSSTVEFYQPWNIWASALTNCSFRVPFNFDGSVSPSTVSFVSSATKDYRLVASEDNLASGFVSSFDLSGLDLAGNSRGDSPYDAGAFAITPQQVEDFIRSLGGPLVLQVGYRISNNRQRLNIGGGGPEE